MKTPYTRIGLLTLLLCACGSGPSSTPDGSMAAEQGQATMDHTMDMGHPSSSLGQTAVNAAGKSWSDPATWGGQVPGADTPVVIPAGTTVVLDQNADVKNVTVNGQLVFEDRDLELRTDWVMVGAGGSLQIGREDAPFTRQARITLTDRTPGENVMNMGDKLIGVMGGSLDLHGERRTSWTRLAANAGAGSGQLTLEQPANWRVGDRIAVTSTDFDARQTEEVTVTGVSGATISFTPPLRYGHWGTPQRFGDQVLDERAEVGLLTRNIVISGEESSSAAGLGGQVMVMKGSQARIEGVTFDRMGQKGQLRRYPVHFHMFGDAAGNYLRDNALRHNFNRCVVIHGTNNLEVSGNVCNDTVGHAIFMEDGIEHGNRLINNLVINTRRPKSGEEVERSDLLGGGAAGFWISNPDNFVRGNVSAGSEGHGFWLAFPEHPLGLSANAAVWPQRTPLGEFSRNVAHSSNGHGFFVDIAQRGDGNFGDARYTPRSDPTNLASAPRPAAFYALNAYKNRGRGVWMRGDNLMVTKSTFADNRIGADLAAWDSAIEDSLFVGESANKGSPPVWEARGQDGRSLPLPGQVNMPIFGFEFYDGVNVRRSTFANFQPNSQRQAGALTDKEVSAYMTAPNVVAQQLQFINANPVYFTDRTPKNDGEQTNLFQDVDGSVTGRPGSAVTNNNPFLAGPACTFNPQWNGYVCPDARYATLNIGDIGGDPRAIKPLTLTRDNGQQLTLVGSEPSTTSVYANIDTTGSYAVRFPAEPPRRMWVSLDRAAGQWTIVRLPCPGGVPKVSTAGIALSAVSSEAALRNASTSAYLYDAATSTLNLRLDAGSAKTVLVRIERR